MGCSSSTGAERRRVLEPQQALSASTSPLRDGSQDQAACERRPTEMSRRLERFRDHSVLEFLSQADDKHGGARRFSVGSFTNVPSEEVGQPKAVHKEGAEMQKEDLIGYACLKGHKSRESPNQDSFFILKLDGVYSVYGVFDGHGRQGHDISDFVKENLPKMLLEQEMLEEDPPTALREAFVQIQELIIEATEQGVINASNSGSTASVIYHDHRCNMLHVANVGDSRCILGQHDSAKGRWDALELTTDHKLTVPQEYARIQQAGGVIVKDGDGWNYRVYASGQKGPGLNMSRAIGDLVGFSHCGITPYPDVRSIALLEGTADPKRFLSSCTSVSSTAPPCTNVESVDTYSFPPDDESNMEDMMSPLSHPKPQQSPESSMPVGVEACHRSLSPEGETTPVDNQFLLLCSDGIWDYITSMDAVSIVADFQSQDSQEAAMQLAELAKERWTLETQGEFMDDITAIVVNLNPNRSVRGACGAVDDGVGRAGEEWKLGVPSSEGSASCGAATPRGYKHPPLCLLSI
mmetsp:Transcript_28618/g.52066  ORF Transcript_28618/g.52066 Transcript_28618/m.52066 type:complete len:521 (+) Transcript_28618:31-1593(+)